MNSITTTWITDSFLHVQFTDGIVAKVPFSHIPELGGISEPRDTWPEDGGVILQLLNGSVIWLSYEFVRPYAYGQGIQLGTER